eukprot:3144230-Rhodomonas_salina.1
MSLIICDMASFLKSGAFSTLSASLEVQLNRQMGHLCRRESKWKAKVRGGKGEKAQIRGRGGERERGHGEKKESRADPGRERGHYQ